MTDAALPSFAPAALRSSRSLPFASLAAHAGPIPAEILDAWAELETIAPCSAYQTQAFARAWLATLGQDLTPLFIAAKDHEDRVVALFCLGIETLGPLRRAIFLGAKDSNFNLGLFRTPQSFTRADIEALFKQAARQLGNAAPDIFLLLNLPYQWAGVPNPLALLPHQKSPSFAYGTLLPREAEQFFSAKQSKERRKKLRKKEARLAEIGAQRHLTNDDEETARKILDAFISQKTARCEAQAIDVDFGDPCRQRFFERLGVPRDGQSPVLEVHALACGEKIIAVFGGLPHRDTFSGMVMSFDADPDIARSSPGELLLLKAIATQCARGVTRFDLGIGEADYKTTYCETTIELFDVIMPATLRGRLFAPLLRLQLRLKRLIKHNPQLLARLRHGKQALRRAFGGA